MSNHPNLGEATRAALASHPVDDVEAALVQIFCEANRIDNPANTLIAAQLRAPAASRELLADAAGADVEDLVRAFENLVPAQQAEATGAVYTPVEITTFMAREVLDAASVPLTRLRAIDPAVGCGALLVSLLREIVARTGRRPSDVVAEQLHGLDIDPAAAHRAGLLLTLTCLALGDDAEHITTHIDVVDALSDLPPHLRGAFDVVIANPPYVRYQQMPLQLRADLSARWRSASRGNFNLHFPFFELAADLLKIDGVSAFICPNRFFTSLSGGPLREWMAETGYLDDIVDFGHHKVFDALTYTAITFGRRRTGEPATAPRYLPVATLAELEGLPGDWRVKLTAPVNYPPAPGKPWLLVGKADVETVHAIEHAGRPLHTVADMRFGVATCRDKLYLLDGNVDAAGNYLTTYGDQTFAIEPQLTRRCPKVSDAADQDGLRASSRRIIYPYTIDAGHAEIIPEDRLRTEFPLGYAYLCAIRAELATRDKGRKTYATWYAYGRTQGLVPSGVKLLTPLYAAGPRFLREDDANSLFVNGCAVTAKGGFDLGTLELVLNSAVCRYYVEKTAIAIDGGFFAYQKSQLANFGVVELSTEESKHVRALAQPERDRWLADRYHIALPTS